MRDASQAPRNSRELAVRNQFFTPRYVVEFLVDNTLGRLWFNATGGKPSGGTLPIPAGQARRTAQAATKLRDPRTLKLLDPACGSMHFRPVCLRPVPEIYREAWDWEQETRPRLAGSRHSLRSPELKPLSRPTRRGGLPARRAAPDHRTQHLWRGHRPARRADRLPGAVAAGATRLA
jgi:hypothetical protein